MKALIKTGWQITSMWLILLLVSCAVAAPSSTSDEVPDDSESLNESQISEESSDAEKHQGKDSNEMDSRGFYGDTFDEGLKRFSPYKRSDPISRKKRNSYDPGYMSYMSAVGYDPTMAWGKRKRNGYMESIGYDPSLWGKRNDFGDYYYPQQFLGPAFKRSDTTYNDVYVPYQFFHGFKKRSISPSDYVDSEDTETEEEGEGSRHKREAELGEQNEQQTIEKRRPEMDASGFHGDVFSNGFGDFYTLKKRRLGMGARGFHGDTFNQGFGDFSTMRKRRPEMDSSGFYGDTFSNGFGDFYTMKRNSVKRRPEMDSSGFYGDTFSGGFGDFYTMKRNLMKRRPEMDSSGFYGDTFSNGFGDFYTMKKKESVSKASSVNENGKVRRKKRQIDHPLDVLKRRPEMTSSGFHGDTFSNGFGDFYTMKRSQKRRPEMDSSGFYGDTFSGGFGDFYTMKKRLQDQNAQIQLLKYLREVEGRSKRSIDASEEIDLTESVLPDDDDHDLQRTKRDINGLPSLLDEPAGKTLQKRHFGADSRGFHGDAFSDGFGDFTTMRRR